MANTTSGMARLLPIVGHGGSVVEWPWRIPGQGMPQSTPPITEVHHSLLFKVVKVVDDEVQQWFYPTLGRAIEAMLLQVLSQIGGTTFYLMCGKVILLSSRNHHEAMATLIRHEKEIIPNDGPTSETIK